MENAEIRLSKYHTMYNFYHVLFKRWKMAALCFFFAFGSVFLSALVTEPTYKQVSKVLVRHSPSQEIVFYRELSTFSFNFRVNPMANYMEVVASREIGAEAVERYNLAERLREQQLDPKTFHHRYMKLYSEVLSSPITLLKWLLESMNLISQEEEEEPDWYNLAIDKFINDSMHILVIVETAVIMIEIYGETVAEAADMANWVAQRMEEEMRSMDVSEADTALKFSEEQISRLNDEIEESEQAIIDFLKENQIVGKRAENQVVSRKLEILEAAKATEEVRKEENDSRVKTLRSMLSQEYVPAATYQLFNAQLAESEKEAAVLYEKLKTIQTGIKNLKTDNLMLQEKLVELDHLEKEVKVRKAQVDMLRATIEKLIIQRINSLSEHDFIIIEKAKPWTNKGPSWPIMSLNIVLGLICGLSLALVVPFLIEFWRETYTIPYEVEKQLSIPVVATIPESSSRRPFKNL